MPDSPRIERFDPRRATETEFAGYHAVVAASEAADRPGEPGLPLAEVAGRLTEPLPRMGPAAHWVARRGDVAGFTEVCLHPRRPDWAYQRDTAVLAGHRGHGLGRCVKAHLARWLVAERPAVARISTTTGEDNAHMLRVNADVGYTTLRSVVAMRQDLAEPAARLG
ncbi:GNAT family N-acetyltransferase [Amycolatopsis balhimycina DSM 5908]|uniref:GNAT family N-acetyltransferase n=1 Tax=Amycolatopsis balhimycina DSM 5908 TaxID=1081091 RepID=A0A428WYP5_AMYBA|nr:GNAT family N-acetyltransferase [Amycolatopsis balhimycina]RSM48214.1 GNAT family N-acetyltransferase [Amycolatopsis balhimycina DSM 5908]